MGEEKAEAIKTHVKVDLDVKDQEDVATTDAKTQVSSAAMFGQHLASGARAALGSLLLPDLGRVKMLEASCL